MHEYLVLIPIFFIGFIASIVSAMVGSGGIISLPLLIMVGLPPQIATATHRFGTLGLCFGGISKYQKEKKINWKFALSLAAISLPGVYFGSKLLLEIDTQLISKIIGILIIAILPFILFQKKLTSLQKEVKKSHKVIGYILNAILGVYSGFIGAGTGTLSRYNTMLLFKLGIVEANAVDMIPGLFSSILSVAIFAKAGIINYSAGAVMIAGMFIGGYTGAHIALKKGDDWLRWVFAAFTIAGSIKLIFFS